MKVIYNVTIKVSLEIAADWRYWMLRTHLPMLMQTGCFEDAKLFRLLEQDDSDGPTFCAQYLAKSKADYENYLENHAADMRAETLKLWGDKVVAFRSVMQQQEA
ncbi:MAG: DUF4286 family protein [Chitinophagaceae bacterium]|nr:DUF4286 family protein [Chitinophagaceae bacterium]